MRSILKSSPKEPISEKVFDTGAPANPYPSISGTHKGTIKPNQNYMQKLYTYPCAGTGGHTESVVFYYPNGTKIAEGRWGGYTGDWHNITIYPSFTMLADHTYNYTKQALIHRFTIPVIDRIHNLLGVHGCEWDEVRQLDTGNSIVGVIKR